MKYMRILLVVSLWSVRSVLLWITVYTAMNWVQQGTQNEGYGSVIIQLESSITTGD
jgi:uncharacterized protein YggT (Ycf19 family)